MITNEEKRTYENVKKAYFMNDFLKRVKERKETGSCLEGLAVEELKKNKIFLDEAYDYFRQTEVKDRTYNDILDSVIDSMEFQIKRDVYYKNVWKFIRCTLDDEHYAEAEYAFFDTMTEGKRSCFENLPFDPIYSGVEGSIEYKETFSFDNKPSSFRLSQTQENCFYVTEVHLMKLPENMPASGIMLMKESVLRLYALVLMMSAWNTPETVQKQYMLISNTANMMNLRIR